MNSFTLKRKEKGLTQQQLANKLSVSFQAVSKWENGGLLMLRYYQIWPLLEITVDELLAGVEKELEDYHIVRQGRYCI